ncbi:MAG: RusA family crossover junction endodeoxyribonuclease [Bilophila wadsworthia]
MSRGCRFRIDPEKQREAMLRGEIAHTKKPDLDNMAKQLKDAMTRAGFWGMISKWWPYAVQNATLPSRIGR